MMFIIFLAISGRVDVWFSICTYGFQDIIVLYDLQHALVH